MGSEAGPAEDVEDVNSQRGEEEGIPTLFLLVLFGLNGAGVMRGALCMLGNGLALFCGGSHSQTRSGIVGGNTEVNKGTVWGCSHNPSTQEVGQEDHQPALNQPGLNKETHSQKQNQTKTQWHRGRN